MIKEHNCPLALPSNEDLVMNFRLSCLAFLSLVLQVAAHVETYGQEAYRGRHFDGLTRTQNLSAQDIVDKGIEALGGRANLDGLQGVTSHA